MIVAYADAFSGISGDMFLGALLDAGLPGEILKKELAGLALDGYQLQAAKTEQHGLAATRINITIAHDHHHRTFRTIKDLLEKSSLAPGVKAKSLAIFSALAQAEGQVHGCPPDEVHFHEVGAVDAIIDIVGAAIGLHHFGIEQLFASPLPLSRGWVECAHGRLPLPAPAVCEELVKGMPVYGTDLTQELVTPTGAAILKGCCCTFGPFPPMTIDKVGYGAGSRQLANHRPNLLRLVVGSSAQVAETQEVRVLETHLDDWQPEGFPFSASSFLAKAPLTLPSSPCR